jgi:hypothetical protein
MHRVRLCIGSEADIPLAPFLEILPKNKWPSDLEDNPVVGRFELFPAFLIVDFI